MGRRQLLTLLPRALSPCPLRYTQDGSSAQQFIPGGPLMPRQHRMFSVFAAMVMGLCLIAPAIAQDQGKTPPASKKSVAMFKSGNAKITVWQWSPPGPGKHPGLVLLHGIDGLDGIN